MDELRPISTVERLIKTNSIWLLATMSRAGAVHILKDKETGVRRCIFSFLFFCLHLSDCVVSVIPMINRVIFRIPDGT